LEVRALENIGMASQKHHLGFGDVCGLLLCWAGATTIVYLTKDGIIAIICVAAGYYLSKWIILKRND
jgi:hypothetical protein